VNPRDRWQNFADVTPDWFIRYIGLEENATHIRAYESRFVPGLFQTPDYARTIISLEHTDPGEIERRVELRLSRQLLVYADPAPMIFAVIDQTALTSAHLESVQARAQLDRLIELDDLPNVTIRIIQPNNGAARVPEEPFTILRFSDPTLPDVVYLEKFDTAVYLDQPADVAHYDDVLNRICADPDPTEPTRDQLRRLRSRL
jgi:Domain of unknown function (DUF5753)